MINAIISGVISDWLQNRPIVIVANMLLCLAGNVFVAVWEAPDWLKFTGYILITAGLPAQSLTIAWLNEVVQGNGTLRGLIVSLGNTMVYAINAWALVLLFPAVDGMKFIRTVKFKTNCNHSSSLQGRIPSLCRHDWSRHPERLCHLVPHQAGLVSSRTFK